MILDFSVLREGDEKLLQTLQSAVKNKQVIRFTYTNHAQLVFTTHDTRQLSNQLLRRDEVWFVEKDENYPMEDGFCKS